MIKKILLIDDNLLTNGNFINKLKEKYDVDSCAYLSTAMYKLKKSDRYSLIILDVMMPPEIYEPENVNNGLRTGYQFFKDYIDGKIGLPVLVWTWDNSIKENFHEEWGEKTHLVIKQSSNSHLLDAVINVLE